MFVARRLRTLGIDLQPSECAPLTLPLHPRRLNLGDAVFGLVFVLLPNYGSGWQKAKIHGAFWGRCGE